MPEQTEQEKIDNTRYRISEIKNDVFEIKSKMDEMYTALMGSTLSKDGGLVARIIAGEEQIEKLSARITEMEKKEDRRMLYLSIIIAIISALSGWVISAFISHLINAN